MAALPADVELILETAGHLAALAGRPEESCPYCPVHAPDAREAWVRGWRDADAGRVSGTLH